MLDGLGSLINEVTHQAGTTLDAVYLTGGMARATMVREHLKGVLGELHFWDSDHFASVSRKA